MNNKNFFLGLGIGIVISSIMLYSSFIMSNKTDTKNGALVEMSDEEVISKAKKLGMVLISGLPATNKLSLSDEDIIVKAKELGMIFELEGNVGKDVVETNRVDNTKITEVLDAHIPGGSSAESVSEILYELGLIVEVETFTKYIKDNNKSTKIRAGYFKINKGSTYDEILTILTTPPQ